MVLFDVPELLLMKNEKGVMLDDSGYFGASKTLQYLQICADYTGNFADLFANVPDIFFASQFGHR